MDDNDFIKKYLLRYKESLFNSDVHKQIIETKNVLVEAKDLNKKVMIAGNGGSAAMASHISVDFTKQAGVRTMNFNDADLITCFANDYGYENWVSKALEFHSEKGDIVILVSSSGNSLNMVNAAKAAKKLGLTLVTLTGFDSKNALKKEGDINLWLDSVAYNIVENTHQIWLLMICDMIIGSAEYSA